MVGQSVTSPVRVFFIGSLICARDEISDANFWRRVQTRSMILQKEIHILAPMFIIKYCLS